MGNSIASVIANEFTEATYDLYLSALVELGLVLLLVSVVFSAAGRLLIWRDERRQAGRPSLCGRRCGASVPQRRPTRQAAVRSAPLALRMAMTGRAGVALRGNRMTGQAGTRAVA